MSGEQIQTEDPLFLRLARRFLFFAPIAFLISFFSQGIAPAAYLLAVSIGGVVWFLLVTLTWRYRTEGIRFLAMALLFLGLLKLEKSLPGSDAWFVQGMAILMMVAFGLTLLTRKWLLRFVRPHAS